MSMWQFFAMIDGMTQDAGGLSNEEADDLWEWIQAKG